jgi:hypothetical protein
MDGVLGASSRTEERAGCSAVPAAAKPSVDTYPLARRRAEAQRTSWLRRVRRRALARRTAWLGSVLRRKAFGSRLHGRARSVSPALVVAISAFLLGVHDAYAVDLSSGFTEAGNKYKSYVKQGISLAGLLCTVISLGMGGFKFMNKDPGAVWYVLGVVGGAVLFGVAQGVMS